MKLLDIVKSVKETREGIRELYEDFEYLRHYEKSLVILLLISSVTLTFGIDWSPTEAEEAFRTQGAYANAETSSRQIFCGEGVVTRDLISPEFEELCWDCWTGNIPSPIDDWYCFMTPSLMGYEYCPICWFAADMGIETYQEIGNGIFFPQESYTPKLQAYIDNGYSWEKDTDD